MKIHLLHPNAKLPVRSTSGAGGYDIIMPEPGEAVRYATTQIPLGFAAAVPEGHVALILPRSGVGSRLGLCLNNTVGVIDSDYRGEWIANISLKTAEHFVWQTGDRILQFLIVPVALVELEEVDILDDTQRGSGGLGSTGA